MSRSQIRETGDYCEGFAAADACRRKICILKRMQIEILFPQAHTAHAAATSRTRKRVAPVAKPESDRRSAKT